MLYTPANVLQWGETHILAQWQMKSKKLQITFL